MNEMGHYELAYDSGAEFDSKSVARAIVAGGGTSCRNSARTTRERCRSSVVPGMTDDANGLDRSVRKQVTVEPC